ncbi:MAG: hypothetical protein AABY92_10005, partial [Thermodesulfobacteriota bacterium]
MIVHCRGDVAKNSSSREKINLTGFLVFMAEKKKFYEEIYPLSLFVTHFCGARDDVLVTPNLDDRRSFDAVIHDHSASPPSELMVETTSARDPQEHLRMEYFVKHRTKEEPFFAFVKRVGKALIRELLEPLNTNFPSHEAEPAFYSDWGDPRQYSIGDIGIGECAGEVVSRYQFEMTSAERLV